MLAGVRQRGVLTRQVYLSRIYHVIVPDVQTDVTQCDAGKRWDRFNATPLMLLQGG